MFRRSEGSPNNLVARPCPTTLSTNMSDRPQQFTFIDVTAHKPANKKKIKSHVANDTNRRKRQTAVKEYQETLLQQVTEQRAPSDDPPIPRANSVNTTTTPNASSPPSREIPKRVLRSDNEDDVAQTVFKRQRQVVKLPGLQQDAWSSFTASLIGHDETYRLTRTADDRPILLKRSSSDNSTDTVVLVGNQSPSSDFVAPYIPRINSPTQLGRADASLRQMRSFFHGKYEATWSQCLKANPYHYQHDYEIGIWRECFFLAFDQLQSGKSVAALTILDATLSATSAILKKQHPNLVHALLEIMREARCVKDQKLSGMLQSYLGKMATYILGPGHPVTLLVESVSSRRIEANAFPEPLFQAAIDIVSELFGQNDFHTMGQKFGSVRRHMLVGDLEAAQDCLDEVDKVWKVMFPVGSLPLHVLSIEKAQVSYSREKKPMNIDHVLYPALRALEDLARLSIAAPPPENVQELASVQSSVVRGFPSGLEELGKSLAGRSYHALLLHVYTHVDEVFQGDGDRGDLMVETPSFATKVARTALPLFKDSYPT